MKVHQKSCTLHRAFGESLFPFTCIHKLLAEAVSIIEVVTTAAPQPVSWQISRSRCSATATARQLSLSAGTAHCIDHASGADSVCECCLSAPWKSKQPPQQIHIYLCLFAFMSNSLLVNHNHLFCLP